MFANIGHRTCLRFRTSDCELHRTNLRATISCSRNCTELARGLRTRAHALPPHDFTNFDLHIVSADHRYCLHVRSKTRKLHRTSSHTSNSSARAFIELCRELRTRVRQCVPSILPLSLNARSRTPSNSCTNFRLEFNLHRTSSPIELASEFDRTLAHFIKRVRALRTPVRELSSD